MIDAELIKKVRQIQIYTSHMVNADFAGQYESVFKGRGMQFEEVREYTPGDDVRTIDWNVTARAGKPYVKQFVEEREMTVMLAVDLSASGDFGTVGRLKNELAAEFCAVLAFAAVRNNDKVGLIIFTDQIELFIPPKKGSSHVLRLIRELLYFKMLRKKTDIALALDYLGRVTRKKATVFLVSDFVAEGYIRPLSLVNRRHDVIAVAVQDPAEAAMPSVGLVEFADAETGEVALVDTSSRAFRRRFAEASARRLDVLESQFASINVDCIQVRTDRPYIHDLVRFFHKRHRRY
ncbi:MAG TPA: DUF58 domain-containing protein [Anaerohalosphaeraceae bacterium]|jgi:uncharacterized protein (DUF58 family)|nr:DUF58 domain-containing protein [Anaerohalosphaeraceae bacterium]HRT51668.1 DUF58 domain-containing protein [Anaerohalosphaeraceae bacterium]HRT87667.1 DUF58 domain-containing protein [Anaerohalosphaeraceae bacterium]